MLLCIYCVYITIIILYTYYIIVHMQVLKKETNLFQLTYCQRSSFTCTAHANSIRIHQCQIYAHIKCHSSRTHTYLYTIACKCKNNNLERKGVLRSLIHNSCRQNVHPLSLGHTSEQKDTKGNCLFVYVQRMKFTSFS